MFLRAGIVRRAVVNTEASLQLPFGAGLPQALPNSCESDQQSASVSTTTLEPGGWGLLSFLRLNFDKVQTKVLGADSEHPSTSHGNQLEGLEPPTQSRVLTTVSVDELNVRHANCQSLQSVVGVLDRFPSASQVGIVQLLVELGSQFPKAVDIRSFDRLHGDVKVSGFHKHLKSLQVSLIQQTPPKAAVNIAKAFTVLKYKPGKAIQDALCFSMRNHLGGLELASMADFMQAFSMLGCNPGQDLMDQIGVTATGAIEKSLKRNVKDVQDVLHLISAFAALDFKQENFLEVASEFLCSRVKVLTEQGIADLLMAFAKLNYRHSKLLDDIVQESIVRQPDTFTPSQLSTIVHSLALLKHSDVLSEILMDITALSAVKRITQFTSAELANLIWSYTQLFRYHNDKKLLECLTSNLTGKVHELQGSPDQLVNLVEAVAASDLGPDQTNQILSSVSDLFCSDLMHVGVSDMVRLLVGFSRARHYSKRLFNGSQEVIVGRAGELSDKQLVQVMLSYAIMTHHPGDEALKEWVGRIGNKEQGQMSAKEVCSVIWSLAIFELLDVPTFEGLCNNLGEMSMIELSAGDVLRLMQTEMLLDIECQKKGIKSPKYPEPFRSQIVQAWRERVYFNHSVSSFQKEVGCILMKLAVPYEQEKLIMDGDSRVDFEIAIGTPQVALECDGPRRFTSNAPYRTLGDTLASRRILKGRGWRLMSISKHEWNALYSSGAQEVYLKQLLQKAVA